MRGKLQGSSGQVRREEASMRPAHYAREVASASLSRWRSCKRFNEARALCAGSWQGQEANEWTPKASMRPAHYAREVAKPLAGHSPRSQLQ